MGTLACYCSQPPFRLETLTVSSSPTLCPQPQTLNVYSPTWTLSGCLLNIKHRYRYGQSRMLNLCPPSARQTGFLGFFYLTYLTCVVIYELYLIPPTYPPFFLEGKELRLSLTMLCSPG